MRSFVYITILSTITLFGCDEKEEIKPGVTTINPAEITISSAIVGGNIYEAGSSSIIEHGICWSTEPEPTIENDRTFSGPWLGTFTFNITPLRGGAIYYARAYATNSVGTSYGDVMEFRTLGDAPWVSTIGVQDNVPPKATLVGNFRGNLLPTKAYFEYGTTASYGQKVDIVVPSNSNPDSFRSLIEGLTPNTLYHFRIVAENEAGTTYGEDFTFTSKYELGQRIGESFIFYIEENGLHGMVCPITHIIHGYYLGGWSESLAVTGATGEGVGSGATNTALIVAKHGTAAHYAYFINTLSYDGYSDWVMASKEELDLIYKNVKSKKLASYASTIYWSSTEQDKDNVWVQDFTSGSQLIRSKLSNGPVAAAVRRF